jgi:hypothetical protein
MSQYSQERNGTNMGEPSNIGSVKPAKGNGVGNPSFKSGSPMKGVPVHNTGEFPKFPGYGSGGKEQRNSTIGKGSI